MAKVEIRILGLPVYRREIKAPVSFEVPTAYRMAPGGKLCLQDDGNGFRWVKVENGQVSEFDLARDRNKVELGSRVPFISRHLVLT